MTSHLECRSGNPCHYSVSTHFQVFLLLANWRTRWALFVWEREWTWTVLAEEGGCIVSCVMGLDGLTACEYTNLSVRYCGLYSSVGSCDEEGWSVVQSSSLLYRRAFCLLLVMSFALAHGRYSFKADVWYIFSVWITWVTCFHYQNTVHMGM